MNCEKKRILTPTLRKEPENGISLQLLLSEKISNLNISIIEIYLIQGSKRMEFQIT